MDYFDKDDESGAEIDLVPMSPLAFSQEKSIDGPNHIPFTDISEQHQPIPDAPPMTDELVRLMIEKTNKFWIFFVFFS